jgi:hypothetical protein
MMLIAMPTVRFPQEQSSSPAAPLVVGLPENQIPSFAVCRKLHAHYRAELARLDVLRHQGGEFGQTGILTKSYLPCS